MKKGWKTWQDYLSSEEDYHQKMESLRTSSLCLLNPQNLRGKQLLNRVWISFVPPEFSEASQQFFKKIRSKQKIQIKTSLGRQIKQDAFSTFSGAFSHLSTPEKPQKIITILSIFITKRPDIGYLSGMNYIAGLLLTIFPVQKDAFVLFSHIIENVYPENFFSKQNRKLIFFTEMQIFVKMAEKLRPELLKSLQAVFRSSTSRIRQFDFSSFEVTMQRIAEVWFLSLFAVNLQSQDVLRVWDNFLIQGVQFLHKFGIAFLQKNERFLKNSIKQQTKLLKMQPSVDALITAGNISRIKLFRKVQRLPIEKLIKKALFKSTYISIYREMFLEEAEKEQRKNIKRLVRLRQSKNLLKKLSYSWNQTKVREVCESLNRLETGGSVSRGIFTNLMTKVFEWDPHLSLNIFVTLDQKGKEVIQVVKLQCGLSVLCEASIQEKLSLIFDVLDSQKTGEMEGIQVYGSMAVLENCLDYRENYYQENYGNLFFGFNKGNEEKLTKEDFLRCVLSDPAFFPIIEFINAIQSEEIIETGGLRMVNFQKNGHFSGIHSPVKTPKSMSSISEGSYDGANVEELEQKLSSLAMQRNSLEFSASNYIQENDVKIELEDGDIQGVVVDNFYENGKLIMKFHIGEIQEIQEQENMIEVERVSEQYKSLEDQKVQEQGENQKLVELQEEEKVKIIQERNIQEQNLQEEKIKEEQKKEEKIKEEKIQDEEILEEEIQEEEIQEEEILEEEIQATGQEEENQQNLENPFIEIQKKIDIFQKVSENQDQFLEQQKGIQQEYQTSHFNEQHSIQFAQTQQIMQETNQLDQESEQVTQNINILPQQAKKQQSSFSSQSINSHDSVQHSLKKQSSESVEQEQKSEEIEQYEIESLQNEKPKELDLETEAIKSNDLNSQPNKEIRGSCSRLCSRNSCEMF